MYHICFVYCFYSFQHSQLRPTSKDSQFHMEIYWHYLWTLSRVHGSHYGTYSKCLYFLATPHCSASGLLGQTLHRLGKSREWPQESPVSKCPMFLVPPCAQYSSGTPQEKSWAVKFGEHGGQLTEAQREKRRPLIRSCSQARLSRDVRVWVAVPFSWNDCWLSVPAHFELRARKKRLSTARYRRVMTVTVSPATFKSERWLQARLKRTRVLKINARLAHLTRQEVKAHF